MSRGQRSSGGAKNFNMVKDLTLVLALITIAYTARATEAAGSDPIFTGMYLLLSVYDVIVCESCGSPLLITGTLLTHVRCLVSSHLLSFHASICVQSRGCMLRKAPRFQYRGKMRRRAGDGRFYNSLAFFSMSRLSKCAMEGVYTHREGWDGCCQPYTSARNGYCQYLHWFSLMMLNCRGELGRRKNVNGVDAAFFRPQIERESPGVVMISDTNKEG